MALLVGIVLTLVSISLFVRQNAKHKDMGTAANVAYHARDEGLYEIDNLHPPPPPRNKPVCPEYATIADPHGAIPSNNDKSLVKNMKENVAYDVIQNKWDTDTPSTSGYATIEGATASQGDPATEVNDACDVVENKVDCEKRSNEVDVKDNIAYSIEPEEERRDYVIVSDGITNRKVFL